MKIAIPILVGILLIIADYFFISKVKSSELKVVPVILGFVSSVICAIILYFTHALNDGIVYFYVAAYGTLLVLTSVIVLLFCVNRNKSFH